MIRSAVRPEICGDNFGVTKWLVRAGICVSACFILMLAGCGGGSSGPSQGGSGGGGNAGSAALSPGSLSFGYVPVGSQSIPQVLTLTNSGTTTLTITSITASSNFTVTNNCGGSLPATAICRLTIDFAPAASGSASGTVTVTDNASPSTQTAAVTGMGTQSAGAAAVLSPTGLSFGNETIGSQSAPQVVTLTNTGAATLTISSIVPTTGFTETNNCPSSLGANATCQITLNFTPTAAGPLTGAVTVTDSDSPSTQSAAMTGVGAQAAGTIPSTSPTTCGTGATGTCTILTVSCPNITDITATLWVQDATVTPIGTVMLIVGLGGNIFMKTILPTERRLSKA